MCSSTKLLTTLVNLTTHYEEERARYNAAFAKFDAVRNQYRARECGDAEFLAAKNADLIDEIKAYRNLHRPRTTRRLSHVLIN